MSKLGGATALVAEAALWVTGAALLVGAAGFSLSVQVPGLDTLGLSGSPTPIATSAGPTANPSSGPNRSASAPVASSVAPASTAPSQIAEKYRLAVAADNFQFKAKFIETESAAPGAPPIDFTVSGSMAYKAGDDSSSQRVTSDGAVTTYDYVNLGIDTYTSKNGAAWERSDRVAAEIQSDKLLFAPTMELLDKGMETKNGVQLHRLEVADPAAFSASLVTNTAGATDGLLTYVVWVDDTGVPADFRIEGWITQPINGASTKVTTVEEFRIVATAGVSIAPPV